MTSSGGGGTFRSTAVGIGFVARPAEGVMFDISYDKTCARAVAINLPWQVRHGAQTLALLVSDWTVLSVTRKMLKRY
jgi:hypothetical protein